MSEVIVQPPGQQQLFPAAPARPVPPYRVIETTGRVLGPFAHVALAASAAIHAAKRAPAGPVWLVAGDGSFCRVTPTGVTPVVAGWPALVARIIETI